MIVPAFGCIFFLIAACFVSVVYPAETSSNTETWPWPYRTRAPEIPLNATDVESKESNTKPDRSRNGQNARKFPSISPIIRVRVFEPNSSRTAIHSPVKIHVVSAEDSTKLRKRSHGPILLPDDNFISRSSSVMEYDGYPVLQKQPKSKSIEPKILEIPNELQGTDSLRNSGSSRTIWPNKDRPRDRKDKERKKNKGKKRKKDRKNKLKVRAIMYEEMKGFPTRKVPPIGTTFVSLHSPRRLHIPVWGKGKRNGSVPVDTSSESSKHKQCFQCPTNITYTADKKKSSLTLPVPSVAICRKHAMRRGRLNLAVLSGPSPGTILSEGEYPTHLIGWKAGGPLYSCHYKVTVEVKRCPDLSSKEGLEVECEDGNVWGSSCKFSCVSSGKALTGANNAVCVESENGVMEWSSPLPVCGNKREPEIVATPRHRKPCKAPPEPSHGAIVCNTQLEDGFYQSNTICQFFCFPGYELQPDSEDSLVVCKKGSWTPKADITCKAVHCPRLKSPENGKIKCKSPVKDPSGNGGAPKGTTCAFNCNPGFVIPSSMEHLKYVECLAPEWNQTSVPECKQKVTPKPGPGECKDKTYYITQNNEVRLSNPLFFVEHDNGTKIQIRNVSCTHKSGKLIVGKHANKCTAYDSELDSIGSCTYTIEVKEKSCKAPRNIQKSKLNCTYRKRPISNGNYLPGTVCEISCETGYAFSQQLGSKVFSRCLPNLRWNRSWKLSCRKVSASCPALDSIPNGNVTCRAKANGNTHSVSSLCSYVCDDGFVVPTSHLALVSRRCKPNGQWNETKAPSCIRAIPPQPDNTTCSSTGLSVDGNPLLPFPNTTFPSPEFVTADGNRITSNCTESSADSNGLINVTCTAYDSEVRSWGSCSFNINSTAEVFEPAVSGEPVTIVADCQAVILAPGNVSELVLPDFTSLLNDTVQTNCTAVNLTEIGVQNVSCVGLDPKTNNSASCSFHVTIIDDADSDSTTVSHSSTVESSTSPSTTETATEPSDSSDTASESSVDDTSFTEPSTTTTDVTTTEVTNGTGNSSDITIEHSGNLTGTTPPNVTEVGLMPSVRISTSDEMTRTTDNSGPISFTPASPDIVSTSTATTETTGSLQANNQSSPVALQMTTASEFLNQSSQVNINHVTAPISTKLEDNETVNFSQTSKMDTELVTDGHSISSIQSIWSNATDTTGFTSSTSAMVETTSSEATESTYSSSTESTHLNSGTQSNEALSLTGSGSVTNGHSPTIQSFETDVTNTTGSTSITSSVVESTSSESSTLTDLTQSSNLHSGTQSNGVLSSLTGSASVKSGHSAIQSIGSDATFTTGFTSSTSAVVKTTSSEATESTDSTYSTQSSNLDSGTQFNEASSLTDTGSVASSYSSSIQSFWSDATNTILFTSSTSSVAESTSTESINLSDSYSTQSSNLHSGTQSNGASPLTGTESVTNGHSPTIQNFGSDETNTMGYTSSISSVVESTSTESSNFTLLDPVTYLLNYSTQSSNLH